MEKVKIKSDDPFLYCDNGEQKLTISGYIQKEDHKEIDKEKLKDFKEK